MRQAVSNEMTYSVIKGFHDLWLAGITVNSDGPSWKCPTAYPSEDPGNAGARDRRRVG